MRIAVVGPGAIGGLVGMRLAISGEDITFIAHGATLKALQTEGLTLVEADGTLHHLADVNVTGSMAEAGLQDIVLLTVKAYQVGPLAADLQLMIGPNTIVVTMENGLPWWYFAGGYGGTLSGTRLESVDPNGLISTHLDPRYVIGAVEYAAARHASTTRVEVDGGRQIIIGELNGAISLRITRLAATLQKAGFDVPVSNNIRKEIWRKLLINMSCNPISALAHATLGDICRLPEGRNLLVDMMREAEAVAQATGIVLGVSLDTLIAAIELFGSHKTSMLQDVEKGHPTEIEALVGAVIELGKRLGVKTPRTETAYALMLLLEQSLTTAHGRLEMRSIDGAP